MEEILEIGFPVHMHCGILPSAEWRAQMEGRRGSEYGPKPRYREWEFLHQAAFIAMDHIIYGQ